MFNNRIRRLACALCALLMLAAMLPLGVSAAAAYPLAQYKDHFKTQGRTAWVDDTLMLDWSVAGVEFTADCSGDVYVTLNALSITDTSSVGGVYFTVVVDGVAQPRDRCYVSAKGTKRFCVAQGLSAGTHTFALYRQTEHDAGAVGIQSVEFADGGTLKAAPAAKDVYIEFIGDSITAAYGNLGDASTNAAHVGKPKYQDATQGYAYLAAKELGADFSVVAWSGIGCKYGYGSISMQDVYPLQRYRYDKKTAHDFTAREPDVVVLALGTNDNANQSNTQLKRAGLVEMLDMVRAKNPNAKILWICNMMTGDVNKMIEDIIEEKGGYKKGYYVATTPRNNAGAGWHPDLKGQQGFADTVVKAIREQVLNPDYNGPTTTTTTTFDWGSMNPVTQNTTTRGGNTTATAADGSATTTTVAQQGDATTQTGADTPTTDVAGDDAATTTKKTKKNADEDTAATPKNSPIMWVAIGLAGLAVAAVVVVIVLFATDKKQPKVK